MDIVAQILGLLAMTVAFLSFQQKTQKVIAVYQMVSAIFWTLHFLLLGAYTGCLLNVIGVARDAVFTQRDTKRWASHVGWFYGTVALCALVYLLTFTAFGTEPTLPRLILELLPVIGMAASTAALRRKEARHVRLLSLISSPLWLVYDFINGSIGGTVTEVVSILSIGIGMYRLDRKKEPRA